MRKVFFKSRLALLTLILSCTSLEGKQLEKYRFSIDLTQAKQHFLVVNLIVPKQNVDTTTYFIPAVIPGTYHTYDFGRFIHAFSAWDSTGKTMKFTKVNKNCWKIFSARKLYRITYEVWDTWHAEDTNNYVLRSAGTNIQPDSNFIINGHGFFGYFDRMKDLEYVVEIIHPIEFYGSSCLNPISREDGKDIYAIVNYDDLVDSPIMYCRPDTAEFTIKGTKFLISNFSQSGLISAKAIKDSLLPHIKSMFEFVSKFTTPEKYSFLFYFSKPEYKNSAVDGALEHTSSSVYSFTLMDTVFIWKTIIRASTHEFLHTVTPLGIRSKEVANFDYQTPIMSEHLWLYEGVTEYLSLYLDLCSGLLTMNDYLSAMHEKMVFADQFQSDVPLTTVSKQCLNEDINELGVFYTKGALVSMFLDLKLRILSEGKFGIMDLMIDLSQIYNKANPFEDSSLFSKIENLTYPQIGEFIQSYIAGTSKLSCKEYFNEIGIDYLDSVVRLKADPLGGWTFGFEPADKDSLIRLYPFFFNSNSDTNQNTMHFQNGDILISINGIRITTSNMYSVYSDSLIWGENVVIKVRRKKGRRLRTIFLKGEVRAIPLVRYHLLSPMENPSNEELYLRNAWLKN